MGAGQNWMRERWRDKQELEVSLGAVNVHDYAVPMAFIARPDH